MYDFHFNEEEEDNEELKQGHIEFDVKTNKKLFREIQTQKQISRRKKVNVREKILKKKISLNPKDQDELLHKMLVT